MTPIQTALTVLLTPLASAAIIMLLLGRRGALASAVSVLASAIVARGALSLALGGARFTGSMEWFRFGSFAAPKSASVVPSGSVVTDCGCTSL